MTNNRQRKVYDFLVDYRAAHGFVPSIREICDGVGLSSTASVARILAQLEAHGSIKRPFGGSPRAIAVLPWKS